MVKYAHMALIHCVASTSSPEKSARRAALTSMEQNMGVAKGSNFNGLAGI